MFGGMGPGPEPKDAPEDPAEACRAPQFPQKAAELATSRPHCVQKGMTILDYVMPFTFVPQATPVTDAKVDS
jgi:hypothetical protein